ncbi:SEL1-like repeat protein [Xanthobacter sp. VTT E-85241]|uniref:hypothetical protein n=1 Tax=Roseixanthobacter finlandensis TaxID=3119922 RepID=UPI0037265AF4
MRGMFSVSGLVLSAILLVGCGQNEEKAKNAGSAGNDPAALKCIHMAVDGSQGLSNALFNALNAFKFELITEIVANCRAVAAEFPNDKRLIVAGFQSTFYITSMAIGVPEIKDGQIIPEKSISQLESQTSSATDLKNVGFYIASAYEYGIGAPQSKQEAEKWYAKAAAAGDKVSERELARLQKK